MNKLTILIISGFLGVGLTVALVAVARTLAKPVAITKRDKPLLRKIDKLKEVHPDGRPQAEAAETEFAFGTLNPGETSQHTFLIRNVGLAPLALKEGPTTCKCTMSDLRNKLLLPGNDTEVRLEWNTGRSEKEFRQSATILTNDPDRPEIIFRVHGKVRLACYAEPQAVRFPDILPGQTESAETLISSQQWENFDISGIETSIEGLTWKTEPLGPGALQSIDARSGYRLIVTSPPNFADAWLNGSLKVSAAGPDESDAPQTLELSVVGKMRSRLAVYGSQINEKGSVELGILPVGKGAKIPLMIRVRDEEPNAAVREIRVRPEFLVAKVTPYSDSSGTVKPGLYHMNIEVPADAPECLHLGAHHGQVVVEFDHPRAKSIAINLNFAVKPGIP